MTLTLVPLRIPSGWTTFYNVFNEVYPEDFTTNDYIHCWEFKEDILQFRHLSHHRILDLGWYPEFDCTGEYTLVLVDSTNEELDWGNPIYCLRTRDYSKLIEIIEDLLLKVSEGRL
ncbi:hypothetical protein [Paenibacillus assamensis]|uniref:hypothetical protein n=1 Tax=Paenibacillus assamensis TaxID=311244 RepID=UPI00048AEC19|nr:hypothetical protein [Paenibacillus assamensis]